MPIPEGIASLGRLWRTLRHHRPRQLAWYLYRRRIQPLLSVPVAPPDLVGRRPGAAMRPRPYAGTPAPGDEQVTFLNVTRPFGTADAVDWHPSEASRLWRYNLHYFDYLADDARTVSARDRLISSWIDANPPGTVDAWEPYTVSLRIINWIDYMLRTARTRPIPESWLTSLGQQAAWLGRNLEHHIGANHLLKNAVALAAAGIFFVGRDADRWLDDGLRLVRQQAASQFLADGGHYERSPMYHAIAVQDLLDVVNLLRRSDRPDRASDLEYLETVARRGLWFLADVLHPDGEIPLFNDSALGIHTEPATLFRYAREVLGADGCPAWPTAGTRLIERPITGYFGHATAGGYMLMDCGPVGPDYQPGHGHCDALSFELSVDGRRLIVDSGVSGYEGDPHRRYVRSTAAHNTVMVDGREQSEIWSTFRIGRRARPLSASIMEESDGSVRIQGAHDGYRFLPGQIVHRRTIRFEPEARRWTIDDRLEGRGEVAAESFLHLHPALSLTRHERAFAAETGKGPVLTIAPSEADSVVVRDGYYCPQFGVAVPNSVLVLAVRARLPFTFGWTLTAALPTT
ncbi:MAG: heparinase [Rhodospirillales bacterium]|nr:MAG: heparinase [Rhodospirillales bacterium]